MPTATTAATDVPTRQAILDGALVAFAEQGFAGCAVPEIAAAAGVSVGSLYRYFPSKEALVNELYRTWKQRLAAEVLAELADGDARAMFDGFWAGMARFVRDHPTAHRFLDRHHHEPYLDEESRRVSHDMELLVLGLIEQAQSDGQIRAGDPAVLAMLVWGAFAGVVRGMDLLPGRVDDAALGAAGALAWSLLDPTSDAPAR